MPRHHHRLRAALRPSRAVFVLGAGVLFCACSAAPNAGAAAPAAQTPATGAPAHTPMNAAAYCAKLQALVQPLVKPELTLFRASDPTTNDMQATDANYVECDFRPSMAQVDISLHEDADHRFDDANAEGFASLPGFGDRARYLSRKQEMRWVDVVRGAVACEARFTMPDADINGDWRQAGGKACEAAFAAR